MYASLLAGMSVNNILIAYSFHKFDSLFPSTIQFAAKNVSIKN